eukprot:5624818-Amphidinium_carterae.1
MFSQKPHELQKESVYLCETIKPQMAKLRSPAAGWSPSQFWSVKNAPNVTLTNIITSSWKPAQSAQHYINLHQNNTRVNIV